MAKNDVALSTQLTIYRILGDMDGLSDNNREKARMVLAGQDNLISLIKKYKIRTGFATDFIMGQYPMLADEFKYRAEYWTPTEVLAQATSQAAEIIRMSGKLNRFGNFGEIREGWVADILLLNGEPLDDLSILDDPDSAIALIMKDGKIVRSSL
jgi:imidazolonepropionase-like amidohydrolase